MTRNDQRHRDARSHIVGCFFTGLGQRTRHPCNDRTEKSQGLEADGRRVSKTPEPPWCRTPTLPYLL